LRRYLARRRGDLVVTRKVKVPEYKLVEVEKPVEVEVEVIKTVEVEKPI
jgi:hypothetical protein